MLYETNSMTKIIVADDHPLVRSGVKATLSRAEDVQVVGEAHDGAEALKLIAELKPDLLILDVDMPGMAAEQIVTEARKECPALKVLILTAHDDEASIRRLMRVKLSAYMLKDEAPENLLQAVRAISQGAVWFSQSVAHKMMGFQEPDDIWGTLTPREKQILTQIAAGKDNQTIASALDLAEQTVRNYASTIYEKIGVATRVEAVVWARDRGIA